MGTLFMAGVLSLAGCLSGPAPTDQFYQLELPEPQDKFDTPPLKGTLQVTRPEANALTRERPLLYRQNSGSNQVHRHTYHRWADSPTIMLQQEITRYLRASHLANQVVTPTFRVKVHYILSCQILKLERILDGSPRVVMELELGITSIQDNQALLLQTYREEQSANGDGINASVVAYNQALSKILSRFLADSSMLRGSEKATNRR
jgi:ABC-type uncharacterized transport system auxiliary subunit